MLINLTKFFEKRLYKNEDLAAKKQTTKSLILYTAEGGKFF